MRRGVRLAVGDVREGGRATSESSGSSTADALASARLDDAPPLGLVLSVAISRAYDHTKDAAKRDAPN